jgi:putative ABC transport system permease protein
VLGLAASSQAQLLAEISKLGTNLLTVTNGQNLFGGTANLPAAAPGMIGQLPGVTAVQYTGTISGTNAYRSPLIPAYDTNALSVQAASLNLPAAIGTGIAQGHYLNTATAREPVAVLGYLAARLMGIDRIWPGERIWLDGQWFYLTGILNPATLAPQIDTSVLVGFPAAEKYLGFNGYPAAPHTAVIPPEAERVHPARGQPPAGSVPWSLAMASWTAVPSAETWLLMSAPPAPSSCLSYRVTSAMRKTTLAWSAP